MSEKDWVIYFERFNSEKLAQFAIIKKLKELANNNI